MHLQPVFNNYPFYGNGLSGHLFDIGLCLPSGTNLTEDNFDRIFAVLNNVFQVIRKPTFTKLLNVVLNDYGVNNTIIASPPLKNAARG